MAVPFGIIGVQEMEMKKLHMGTMSYGFDSMDEVAHQLAVAFGASGEEGLHFITLRRDER